MNSAATIRAGAAAGRSTNTATCATISRRYAGEIGSEQLGPIPDRDVAKAGAEANYTVTMTWRREQPEDEKTK
jgi:hypothetical protein